MYQRSLKILASEDHIGQIEHYLALDSHADGYTHEKSIYEDKVNGVEGKPQRSMLREIVLTVASPSGRPDMVLFRLRQGERVPDSQVRVPCDVYIASTSDGAVKELGEKVLEIVGKEGQAE